MTDGERLPDGVRAFVVRAIDTVAQLEGLLLLRSSPEAIWSSAALASRLYVSQPEADAVLAALQRRGLLAEADGGWRYAPANDQLRGLVDRLAAAYPRHLIAITRIIHAKAPPSVRDFAEAFRFRRKKE
jgi:hypothetical protein